MENNTGLTECLELLKWRNELCNSSKRDCVKKACDNMIKRQVDYEYGGIKGFFKLLFEREN